MGLFSVLPNTGGTSFPSLRRKETAFLFALVLSGLAPLVAALLFQLPGEYAPSCVAPPRLGPAPLVAVSGVRWRRLLPIVAGNPARATCPWKCSLGRLRLSAPHPTSGTSDRV